MPNLTAAELARLNVLLEQGISLIQQDMAIRLTFAGVKEADIAGDLRVPKKKVAKMLRGLTKARRTRSV